MIGEENRGRKEKRAERETNRILVGARNTAGEPIP